MIILPIVYENEDIYIINKPSGLASQGGKGITHSVDTILPPQVGHKIYLVHRLDKETEGLLIVAKSSSAARTWANLIAENEIKKEYYALCIGNLPKEKGYIEDDIFLGGVKKTAITHYTVEKTIPISLDSPENALNTHLSLVRLQLETGRMHQIRIHLAKNNAPIIGDDKYGNFKLNKLIKKQLGIKKLQLISFQLTMKKCHLDNSQDENLFVISIPLPDRFIV